MTIPRGPAWLLAAALLACGRGDAPAGEAPSPAPGAPTDLREGPPHARWDIVDMLREDRDRRPDPVDTGGRAWLDPDPDAPLEAVVGTPGRFPIVFEVGPEGIASGGMICLQVSPFWGWSTPQVESPEAPGYTAVTPSAEDVELRPATLDRQLLCIEVTGRALAAGERIRIVYGAGPLGAVADRFAERDSRFWIAVDGDGDGVRAVLPDSPTIDVRPRGPARLVASLPSVARPGERVRLTLAVLDVAGNTGIPFAGVVRFPGAPGGLGLPERVVFEPGELGRRTLELVAGEPGVYRVEAVGPGEDLETVSNPLVVSHDGPRVLWGDLHGHSNFSDGTAVPEDYFRYARDVAGLDVIALTDHDHWGMLPLEKHPEMWEEIRKQVRRFHEPGRFVTLLGYEWTSWIHGHRHVLYFGDEGEVLSSVDPAYESPLQLWKALEGRPALTFAHHSAGGPIPTNWEIPPDPVLEPVTEIVSVHGSSEALDSPGTIYSPVPGNFVRDALDKGYRFGFVGSGDSHDGHPGLAQLAATSGGLAAILSEEATREGVLDALRHRRVYASNGARILLRTALGSHPMGTIIPTPASGSLSESLFVRVVAVSPLASVELIRSGEVVDGVDAEGRLELALERPVEGLRSGEYVYVRAVQRDGGAAWSSPIYVE